MSSWPDRANPPLDPGSDGVLVRAVFIYRIFIEKFEPF
jgi:hypothetical protein